MRVSRLVVAAMVSVLCGCSGSGHTPTAGEWTPGDLSAGDWEPGDDGGWTIVGGELKANDGGCLYLPSDVRGKQDIVWPKGYTSRVSDDGTVTVLDPDEQVVATTGKPFVARGHWEWHSELANGLECQSGAGKAVVVIESELAPLDDWYTADSHVVTLSHCGVSSTEFDGAMWALPSGEPHFDEENFPDSFVGRGSMVRLSDDEALYTDEGGVEMTFVPVDQLEGGSCA